MIAVSEEFKSAISSSDREIKGYVLLAIDEQTDYPSGSPFSNIVAEDEEAQISTPYYYQSGNNRIFKNKYASLEENYFQLDGSFLLPNENNKIDAGYVSTNLVKDIASIKSGSTMPTFQFTLENIKSSGVTLYFESSNIPTEYKVVVNTNKEYIGNKNLSNIVMINFDEEIVISELDIYIYSMTNENRRIRLNYIDIGRSFVYEGEDLINFKVIEEIDETLANIPTNTCTLEVNNLDGKYNPLNQEGIVRLLKKNKSKLYPYVGVKTQSNGIEFVGCGQFLYSDWKASGNNTVTINSNSYMTIINNLDFIDNSSNLFQSLITSQTQFERFLKSNYSNIEYKGKEWHSLRLAWSNYEKLIDLLKDISILTLSVIKVNRNGVLVITDLDNKAVGTIYRNYMKSEAEYNKSSKINKITLRANGIGDVEYNTEAKNQYSKQVQHQGGTAYVKINADSPVGLGITSITATNGVSVSNLSKTSYYTQMLKLTGNATNTTINIVGYTPSYNSKEVLQEYSRVGTNEEEVTLEIESNLFLGLDINYIAEYYLNIAKDYDVSFDYGGDPSIEAGDTIKVETKYGMKEMFIRKNTITFDGGLSCSIEGVGN